jgi:Na+/H+ antiporter NhaA
MRLLGQHRQAGQIASANSIGIAAELFIGKPSGIALMGFIAFAAGCPLLADSLPHCTIDSSPLHTQRAAFGLTVRLPGGI